MGTLHHISKISFSVLIFYKKSTKNKFSLVYHNCTAKKVNILYRYVHYFNM